MPGWGIQGQRRLAGLVRHGTRGVAAHIRQQGKALGQRGDWLMQCTDGGKRGSRSSHNQCWLVIGNWFRHPWLVCLTAAVRGEGATVRGLRTRLTESIVCA